MIKMYFLRGFFFAFGFMGAHIVVTLAAMAYEIIKERARETH